MSQCPVDIPGVFRERHGGSGSGPHFLASDGFRGEHMVQFWPLRCREKYGWRGRAAGKVFLALPKSHEEGRPLDIVG